MTTTSPSRLPTYFLSHGGGPWPWLTGPIRDGMAQLEESLRNMPGELAEPPKAILMVSAHWEAPAFTVQTSPNPPMLYDFGGFGPTDHIQYPSPGSPALAARVADLLSVAGLPVREDPRRGYDHGMYSVLGPAWPDAEIPVVQLSIKHSYDPDEHLALGRALAPLRDEGVLIIGSGLSFHNLRAMTGSGGEASSAAFDEWLGTTLAADPAERTAGLREWAKAPAARLAHPEEDHLIPLMVVVGAAEDEPAARTYHQRDFFGRITASSFRLGAPTATISNDPTKEHAHV